MPIYAYRCEACGFAKDALQKISDAPLTDCPACGEAKFKKQLTAAGFQLKGTGWYVTDFRNGANSGKSSAPEASKSEGASTQVPAAVLVARHHPLDLQVAATARVPSPPPRPKRVAYA
ncbi:MAG: zinc ribbon domain-containing protein [Oxalobacteraceae bacterium]|nr:zinc ribbon domain-containing protein [Oxalobacteraceae bacterium]